MAGAEDDREHHQPVFVDEVVSGELVHALAAAIGSLAGAILAAFVVRERTTAEPLVRLGVFRSGSLVRANLGAMSLFGGWVGFQFIVTLYLQQLRGWSALDTGLAIFPAGVLVAFVSRPGWSMNTVGG